MKKNTVLSILIAMAILVGGFATGKEEPKRLGPVNNDFNTGGFRIVKVMKIEKEKNALGKLLARDAKFEVGRAVELSKRLDNADRGEMYLIRWKYSGKGPVSTVQLRFDYKLKNRADVHTLSKEYQTVGRGSYRVMVKNVGSTFFKNGEIEYWKTSLIVNGEVAAEKKSILWDANIHLRKSSKNKSEKEGT